MLTLPMAPPALLPLSIDEEGRGRFRGKIAKRPIVGIWKYERGMLALCWNNADKGFPKRFEEDEQHDLLTLWER